MKANKGAAGVDGKSIEDFETDLKDNLYRIWNQDELGDVLPAAGEAVEIPKPGGGVRTLGVPTVADRIAQTVVAARLEPGWSRCSTRTPMGIGPAGRRWTRSG